MREERQVKKMRPRGLLLIKKHIRKVNTTTRESKKVLSLMGKRKLSTQNPQKRNKIGRKPKSKIAMKKKTKKKTIPQTRKNH